jgi:O-antigen ligase/cytochrome c-type biogenesis protein CcmH/NrfG
MDESAPTARAIVDQAAPDGRLTDLLVEAAWLLTALLTPLLVNLWASQPFEPPKAALVRTLVWMAGVCWLVDRAVVRRTLWHDLRGNPLLWPTLAVAGAYGLATAGGIDPGLSLWGSHERCQGLLTLLSYLLLFLIVSSCLRTRVQAERLVGVLVATGAVLACLGLAQALGWQPVPLVSDARSPVYATLGRSNFLGAYLAALLPLTVMWAWTGRRRWQRLAGATLALAEIAVIGLTMARGAWLAAGVGLGVLAAVGCGPRLWQRAARWHKAAFAAGAVLLLAAGLALAIGRLPVQEGSAAARRTIWQASLGLIGRRSWLGYGPDTLGLVFPRVYPPQLVYYQGRGLSVDRAHNLVLDSLVTAGLLGLVAQLALVIAFLALVWRSLRQGVDPWRQGWLAACLAAIVANLAGNLVSFDVTATAVLAALVMALAVALSCPLDQAAPGRALRPAARKPWGRAATALVCLALALAVVEANARPVAADIAARTADRRAAMGDWDGAARAGEQAVALWPAEPTYRRALADVLLQAARLSPDPLPWLERAEAELLAGRDLRPGDWRGWAALGELYGVWGNRWDPGRLPLAHAAYGRAAALAPNHAMLYTSWGMVDLEGGRFAAAAARFRRAVDLDATDGYAFGHLGEAELAQGRVAEALVAYGEAVHWESELSSAHLGLARCYWRLGQREAAVLAVERALQLAPDNEEAWALRQEIEAGP